MIIRTNQGMNPLNKGPLPEGSNPFKDVEVKRGFNQTPDSIRTDLQNRSLHNPKPVNQQSNPPMPENPHDKIEMMKRVGRLNK